MPIKLTERINQGSSALIEFPIEDEVGVLIPKANLTSAIFTLRDLRTNGVINSRLNINVLADISTAGNFSRWLTVADNALVTPGERLIVETHVMAFTIVGLSGATSVTIIEEIWLEILNLRTVA